MTTYLPFGRHRGEPLEEVPEEYLAWLLTVENLTPHLRDAIERQLGVQDRDDWLPSAARTLPLVVWKWELIMTETYGHDPESFAVVCHGRAVLRELCSEVTGQPWPDA